MIRSFMRIKRGSINSSLSSGIKTRLSFSILKKKRTYVNLNFKKKRNGINQLFCLPPVTIQTRISVASSSNGPMISSTSTPFSFVIFICLGGT